ARSRSHSTRAWSAFERAQVAQVSLSPGGSLGRDQVTFSDDVNDRSIPLDVDSSRERLFEAHARDRSEHIDPRGRNAEEQELVRPELTRRRDDGLGRAEEVKSARR